MPLSKKLMELKKIFEKEYQAKGKSKKQADIIFYKYENKHKLRKWDNDSKRYNKSITIHECLSNS